MPTLKSLFNAQDIIENSINEKINVFLTILDSKGGYAPGISDKKIFGAGVDYIDEITIQSDYVIITGTNYFRCSSDGFSLSYPLELVESCNQDDIAKFVILQKQEKEAKEKADHALKIKKKEDDDLKLFKKLQEKYKFTGDNNAN